MKYITHTFQSDIVPLIKKKMQSSCTCIMHSIFVTCFIQNSIRSLAVDAILQYSIYCFSVRQNTCSSVTHTDWLNGVNVELYVQKITKNVNGIFDDTDWLDCKNSISPVVILLPNKTNEWKLIHVYLMWFFP